MKILVLYRNHRTNYNHFCNADFYKYLKEISGVDIKFYGIDVEQLYPSLCFVKYKSNITLAELYKKYNFDTIIVAGKNRSYHTAYEKKSWLPTDFKDFPCLKVLIEPDYHKYRKDNWFSKYGINVILHRHLNNVVRGIEDFPKLHHYWFPYSVDTSVFKPEFKEKLNKVCFVGNSKSNAYYFRKTAYGILQKENLLDFHGLVYNEKYINLLNQYSVYLNGTSLYTIDCAKAFEIIASGGILLTNDAPNGFPYLFDNCYVPYKNDFSDLLIKTNMILNNTDYRTKLIKKGLECINKKHTHLTRCKELVKILSEELYKTPANSLLYQIQESENEAPIDIVYCIGDLDKPAIARFKNSYNSLKTNNSNFNIYISDVGTTSQKDLISSFIPKFEYYYQNNISFDASIAKNNAFKYLLKNELFVFMDIDIIVNNDFIDKVLTSYDKLQRPFNFVYIKLPEMTSVKYQDIINNPSNLKLVKKPTAGVICCDKQSYKELNGYDEDYHGWGGRDSDFILRLMYSDKIKCKRDILVFHQFHLPQIDKYENALQNRTRYQHRKNLYFRKIIGLNEINGLEKLENIAINTQKTPYLTPKEQIKLLISHGIKVCLLKSTCVSYANNKVVYDPLYLGVSNVALAKKLLFDYFIIFREFPDHVKNVKLDDLNVSVPFPLVQYLREYRDDK